MDCFVVKAKNLTFFNSFGVEHIPKEIKKFIRNKNIATSIYRIKAFDSIMSEYFRIGFINCSLKVKSLFDYKHLFTPNEHKKNCKIILKDFR